MDPGGVRKRVRKTIGNRGEQKNILGASGRGDDVGTSLAQGPRGGTIIKEIHFNKNIEQDLTRRWAAGPANFPIGKLHFSIEIRMLYTKNCVFS